MIIFWPVRGGFRVRVRRDLPPVFAPTRESVIRILESLSLPHIQGRMLQCR